MAVIYKITNTINKKIYIGETIRDGQTRWNEHCSRAKNDLDRKQPLYNAMRKYGIENFTFEIIEQCSDEIRFEKETYYIHLYNSLVPYGYNIIIEGEGAIKIPTETIISLWDLGLNAGAIAKQLGTHYAVITNRLKNNGISQKEIYFRQGLQTKERCSHIVEQYTLDGIFLKDWPSTVSVQDAGFIQSAISAVCRQQQKSAYGYLWKYKEDIRPIDEWVNINKRKSHGGIPSKTIMQTDLNNNIIKIYDSGSEAARQTGYSKTSICRAAREHKKYKNYFWIYIEEEDT